MNFGTDTSKHGVVPVLNHKIDLSNLEGHSELVNSPNTLDMLKDLALESKVF